jgi:hypothetical protein
MRQHFLIGSALAAGLLWSFPAQAHCDAADGPVATTAVQALDSRNVNLVFRYVPASAEEELTGAFEQALEVRDDSPEAKALADRYFMETAVRLHRAGEGAAYTGLRPAGTDFGPAIPAAEEALETGKPEALLQLMSEEVENGIRERFEEAHALSSAPQEPQTAAEVPAARERASAELGFIGYVEAIYLATKSGGHAEGGATDVHEAPEDHAQVDGAERGMQVASLASTLACE